MRLVVVRARRGEKSVTHQDRDRISLELARRIAAELPNRPEWIDLARDNIERWSRRNADSPALLRCYAEWLEILSRPVKEVCRVMTAETDEGRRLRQNSPFAGVFPPRELWRLNRTIRHDTLRV